MTQPTARIILDSMSPAGARLTTLQLSYPRFVHSEFMTHRVFSRNSMSSRAVPVQKMIDQVRNNPVMPIHWGSNKPGMQAGEELGDFDQIAAQHHWKKAARQAADTAEDMMKLGLHKQVVNRILEPFQLMHTIVTATEWDNFFALRIHPAAEPNMHALAWVMKVAMDESSPVEREDHVPYIGDEELFTMNTHRRMVSAARCARVSYLNHDGSAPDAGKDLDLATTLAASGHWSPFEHVAKASPWTYERDANFIGWQQFRQQLDV